MLSKTASAGDLLRCCAMRLAIAGALMFSSGFALARENNLMRPDEENSVKTKKTGSEEPKVKEAGKGSESRSESKAEARSASEMARMITELEERVRLLEERLSRLTAGPEAGSAGALISKNGDPVNPEAVPKVVPEVVIESRREIPAVQDKSEEEKKNDNVLRFFRDVEVSGLVDGYYSYNNNKVDMFTQGRAFDVRHNAFSLQLAKLSLQKANSKDNPLGFRIDLGLGETVDRVVSISDSSRNDATKHVLQAYISYVAPVGSGLTLDFGKFYTPVGAEVIETKDNFNYSRGLLFTFGPYYHVGFRTRYAFNDKVALSGFLLNGWDNLFENNVKTNAGKTVGFQLGLAPTKKLAITQTYLTGPEAPLANIPAISTRDNRRHIADTVATAYVTNKLTLLGNFVYGSDGDNSGARGYWTGFAGYFKYAFTDRLAFSPRFEVLNDKDGLRTGVSQSIKDITLTQEIKLSNSLLTRFEFRRDFSNQNFFANSAGVARNNQNTVILGMSYFLTTAR